MSSPNVKVRRQLSRDQRLQILTLRTEGLTYKDISQRLNVTPRAVQYACDQGHPTPKKRRGGPVKIQGPEVRTLIDFVSFSPTNRRLTYRELAVTCELGVGWKAVRNCLQREGFGRRVARATPLTNEDIRDLRLEWVELHLWWTPQMWTMILWTDETWVNGDCRARIFITRRPGEEYDLTCIAPKQKSSQGWMFWGSFAGSQKGPHLFWEKAWGKINSATYSERVLPLVHAYLLENPEKQFMQDNAPPHTSAYTNARLQERGIEPIVWPPNSPDLNPIENVWAKMKQHIEVHHPGHLTKPQLKTALAEAWDSIDSDYLNKLIESMPDRCWEVYLNDGGPIPY